MGHLQILPQQSLLHCLLLIVTTIFVCLDMRSNRRHKPEVLMTKLVLGYFLICTWLVTILKMKICRQILITLFWQLSLAYYKLMAHRQLTSDELWSIIALMSNPCSEHELSVNDKDFEETLAQWQGFSLCLPKFYRFNVIANMSPYIK